jgi:hypothetical protein
MHVEGSLKQRIWCSNALKSEPRQARIKAYSSVDSTRFPIEIEERRNAKPLGLINEPSSSVSSHVYNVYKRLFVNVVDMGTNRISSETGVLLPLNNTSGSSVKLNPA